MKSSPSVVLVEMCKKGLLRQQPSKISRWVTLRFPLVYLLWYSRVSHIDLPTSAPGSLRISPRPQMEGGRLGEGRGKVLWEFYIRKLTKHMAQIRRNQS